MPNPDELDARAAKLDQCAGDVRAAAGKVDGAIADLGGMRARQVDRRQELYARWKGLAQVGFDEEWRDASGTTAGLIDALVPSVVDLSRLADSLASSAADLRGQAARIRAERAAGATS